MSILITGVKMPEKHHIDGLYIDGRDGKVYNLNRTTVIGQAIEIPAPHGRLIDADKYEDVLKSLGSRSYRREKGTIMDAMKFLHEECAPTIIEAEE